MRLIDAEALKQLVDEEWFDCQEKSSFFDEIDRTPTIDEYDVIVEYCQKRCLDIVTGDLFDKLKQEYVKIRNATPVVILQDYPVKHGKWIEEPNCFYRCSNCGRHHPSIRGYMDYKYCPYCGGENGKERRMKFLIYRTSGNSVSIKNLKVSHRIRIYSPEFGPSFQRSECFAELNSIQDLLTLRMNFPNKYGGFHELILTYDKLSKHMAIEV